MKQRSLRILLATTLSAFGIVASSSAAHLLYTLDFGTPPHSVGLAPVLGDGPPPRKTVSAINFGSPVVVASFGSLNAQPLRMVQGDQIRLGLSNLPPFEIYTLEAEVLIASATSPFASFTILFDTPQIRNITFMDGGIFAFVPSVTQASPGEPIGNFSFGQKRLVRSRVDLTRDKWEIFLDANPTPAYSGSFGGAKSIRDIRFSPNLSLAFGTSCGVDNIVIAGDHRPIADAGATELLRISTNGTEAIVILDGSLSSDPDGDALEYAWYLAGQPLAAGMMAAVPLPTGVHEVSLVVSDGVASDTNSIIVEVIPLGSSVVTTTLDEDNGTSDPALGTGTSLREAIIWANLNPGPDTITFDLGPGPHTINLAGPLPSLTTDLHIQGPGAHLLTVRRDTGGDYMVFFVGDFRAPTAKVTISGLTVANGVNAADYFGGGIFNGGCESLTIDRCAITDGGSLLLDESDPDSVVVMGGVTGRGYGGHIFFLNSTVHNTDGIINYQNPITIVNSTICSNALIFNVEGRLAIENSTISANYIGIQNALGTVSVANSIVALNSGGDVINSGGVVDTANYNFIGDRDGDSPLGPLTDNGGPTPTMALLPGSPCINAGDPNFTPPPDFDQRGSGFARVVGGRVDIGAFEVQPPADSDGDGVLDTVDQCPDTPAGDIVNANGCSIAQLVPCAGPRSGGRWKNHGQYVSAVVEVAKEFLNAGLILHHQWSQLVTAAAQSQCGSNGGAK